MLCTFTSHILPSVPFYQSFSHLYFKPIYKPTFSDSSLWKFSGLQHQNSAESGRQTECVGHRWSTWNSSLLEELLRKHRRPGECVHVSAQFSVFEVINEFCLCLMFIVLSIVTGLRFQGIIRLFLWHLIRSASSDDPLLPTVLCINAKNRQKMSIASNERGKRDCHCCFLRSRNQFFMKLTCYVFRSRSMSSIVRIRNALKKLELWVQCYLVQASLLKVCCKKKLSVILWSYIGLSTALL